MDYEEGPLQVADVVQLAVRVNNDPVDAMASMVHRDKAERLGRRMISKLRDILPRQQYQVAIQAVANNKVIARETLSAVRKDVTAKCYGGDISRKKKLLEKQKEGKKRMKRVGSVDIPQDAFVGEQHPPPHPHCAPHVPTVYDACPLSDDGGRAFRGCQ